MRLVALLDACVLYPYHLRDFLIRLFITGDLYQAHWSEDIHEEWTRNLIQNRPDLDRKALTRTVELMNRLPGTLVRKQEYANRIEKLSLPDPNDRHVLAAAIACKADYIVTFNLKDFPKKILQANNIQPLNPDDFVAKLMAISKSKVLLSMQQQITSIKNPPMTFLQLKEKLSELGLKNSMKLVS